MSYIKAENIKITLSGTLIIKDINLTIQKNDFLGVIGPNGSGKSTLLKCIYRALKPDIGTVFLEDKLLHKMPHRVTAQKMGVVNQHNDLQFDFNVFDMVLMGRSPYKEFLENDTETDYQITLDALKKVSMLRYKDRSFETLSGGEKQRVILARALAQKTDCLILDEPTNHLDIRHQLEFMDLVKKLDVTVLSAVHDLNIALLYCNKICIMKNGKVYDFGPTNKMINPQMIKEIYGVEANVINRKDGSLSVVYEGVLD